MAHFAIRGLMHEAALKADEDPDRLSSCMRFALSVANSPAPSLFPPHQLRAWHDAVLDEILQERLGARRNRRNKRGVKRKMSNFPLRRKSDKCQPPIEIAKAIRVLLK